MSKRRSSFKKSLFNRYFAICSGVILATIALMGGLIIGFSASYFKNSNQKTLKKTAEQAVQVTLSSMEKYNYKMIPSGTLQFGYGIIAKANGTTVFLTDLDGKTLVCTDNGVCNHKVYTVPESAMKTAISGEFTETGSLGGIYDGNYYTVGVPVQHGGATLAVIFISAQANDVWYYIMDLMDIIFFCALIATVLSSVVVYFVTNKLTSPLRTMAAATKSFSAGDFSVRVPVEGAVPKEKERQYLETVSDEVKRLSRMVKSMLSVARIEAGDMKISPTNFDINDLVCRTVFNFEQKIEEKNLEIVGLESDEIYVYADNDLIHQVIYNLIDNAVKFVNDGGCISFSFTQKDGKVFVSIKNTGAGIAQQELPRLFDRFYKTDKSRSLDKTGVGLGLYIVQTIINQHKGDLIVQSVEGEYTEFTFSVLASDPKAVKEIMNKRRDRAEEE